MFPQALAGSRRSCVFDNDKIKLTKGYKRCWKKAVAAAVLVLEKLRSLVLCTAT
jgi:hypothetical protein